MLIVMSDLHFADSSGNSLDGHKYNHNLPSEVYSTYFKEIREFISGGTIKEIDLVLAGDIFEITRSALWHQDHLKPYLHNDEILEGSDAEKRVLEVIESIARDERVEATFDVFASLSDYFQLPVYIHFVPGNHDRLANSSPNIRKSVQELLSLEPNGDLFQNQHVYYENGDPLALIRHGHEYDKSNFSADLRTWDEIPTRIDKSYYDAPVLGDIVTSEIASKLPLLYREHYSDATIMSRPELMTMYERLMDFDNVRPSNALMNFLFSTPGLSKNAVWTLIEPVMLKLFDNLALSQHVRSSLRSFGNMKGASAFTLKSVLRTRLWRKGLPFWAIRTLMHPISKRTKIPNNLDLMLREECMQNDESPIKCIVTGHTHLPEVELLKVRNGVEKYYINSGTFRNLIAATPSLSRFGKLRSKARVMVFGRYERNPEYARQTGWSFDFNARYAFGSIRDEEDIVG
jgi:UDP-2,3-diacylglucosamine pyrophosphatase LpxH